MTVFSVGCKAQTHTDTHKYSQQHRGVAALPAEVIREHDQKATETREQGRGVLLIPRLLQSHIKNANALDARIRMQTESGRSWFAVSVTHLESSEAETVQQRQSDQTAGDAVDC